MKILSSLYYDLMSKFPFSITGYDDIETKISQYFTLFCDHPLNKESKDISFIVGVFGQLSGLEELNISTIEKINDWETERIKKFLFCNYEGDRAELPMSFYLYQLQSLLPTKFAINILTKNFRNDIDFRISLSDDENPNFFFHRVEKIFEIKVPKSIYKDEIFNNPTETRDVLREKLQRQLVSTDKDNLLVKYDSINSYELEIAENDNETKQTDAILYDKLGREIFIKSFAQFHDSNRDYLLSKFNTELVKYLIFKNEDVQIEDLLKIAYAGSFLCAYYGVDLEYILSTCRVVGNKSYGLGGLAVGVKNNCDFSDSSRAFYKIISNQIASNLSGQITYNLFSSEVYKEQASKFIYELCDTDSAISRLTHPYKKEDFVELKESALLRLEDLRFKKIIHQKSFIKALEIINSLNEDHVLTQAVQIDLEKLFRWKLTDLVDTQFKIRFPNIDVELKGMVNKSISYHYDFEWLIDVLLGIPFANFIKRVNVPDKKLKIEISCVDGEGTHCPNDDGKPHYLRIRMIDNGQGMELPESLRKSAGSYKLLHKGQHGFEVLQTHGNIEVHSNGKKISLLELHKDGALRDSEVKTGTMFEILLKAK